MTNTLYYNGDRRLSICCLEGDKMEKPKCGDRQHIREHLANERTFLAWIRTGVAILTFGFVIEKFSIYIRSLGAASGQDLPVNSLSSSYFGFIFVLIAAVVVILATVRFKLNQKQIDQGTYQASVTIDISVAVLIILVSFLMAVFWLRY